MGKRKKIDWEAIRRELFANQLSIREIARHHNISDTAIRKKAKREGWTRKLAGKVHEAVREKMVRSEVRTPSASDDEVVDGASDRVIEVLQLQRKDIANLRELESQLIEELKNNPTKLYLTQYKGKIVQKTVALTASERAMAATTLPTFSINGSS